MSNQKFKAAAADAPAAVELPAAPESWNYGSFHLNSRFFTSYLRRQVKSQERLPLTPLIEAAPAQSSHRRLYNEEYFRVLKEYKALSQSPSKQPKGVIAEEMPREDSPGDEHYLELPKETLYLIDKVVRQRMAKGGPFGIENSAVIGMELDHLRRANEANMSRLSGGRAVVLDEDGNPLAEVEDKENVNQELLERLGEACHQDIHGGKRRKLTFDEWKRRKQAEERIRGKLMEDALKDLKDSMARKEAERKMLEQEKQMAVEQWEAQKRREDEQKRLEKEQWKAQEEREKELKKMMSERTYNNWLSEKIRVLKEDKYKKQQEVEDQKLLEQRAKQDQETKRVAAQMAFKLWNKRLKRREREQRRLERLREREAEMQLLQQKQHRGKGGVMLAYSLNKLLKKQPHPQPLRPKRRYSTEQASSVTPAKQLTPTVHSGKIRVEEEGGPGGAGGSKRRGGGGSKKGAGRKKKAAAEPGFEELSSIYPGVDQHSVESMLRGHGGGGGPH